MAKIASESTGIQFLIDITFGVLFIGPMVLALAVGFDIRSTMLFVTGVSCAYFLHVLQKIIVYNEVIQSQVREQAEEQVATEVEQAVEEKAKPEVEAHAEEIAEEKIEENLNE